MAHQGNSACGEGRGRLAQLSLPFSSLAHSGVLLTKIPDISISSSTEGEPGGGVVRPLLQRGPPAHGPPRLFLPQWTMLSSPPLPTSGLPLVSSFSLLVSSHFSLSCYPPPNTHTHTGMYTHTHSLTHIHILTYSHSLTHTVNLSVNSISCFLPHRLLSPSVSLLFLSLLNPQSNSPKL